MWLEKNRYASAHDLRMAVASSWISIKGDYLHFLRVRWVGLGQWIDQILILMLIILLLNDTLVACWSTRHCSPDNCFFKASCQNEWSPICESCTWMPRIETLLCCSRKYLRKFSEATLPYTKGHRMEKKTWLVYHSGQSVYPSKLNPNS